MTTPQQASIPQPQKTKRQQTPTTYVFNRRIVTSYSHTTHPSLSNLSIMFGLSRISILAFVSQQSNPVSRQAIRTFSETTTALGAKNYLLKYEYIPDVLEKRGPYREGHLGLANKMVEEGKCLSGGPTGEVGEEVPTGALFIFTDKESAESYASQDPYVANGIVTKSSIEEWNVVIQKK